MRIALIALPALLAVSSHAQMLRGVNLAGAEFGNTTIPGVFNTHYTFNSELTYRYFAARNLNLIRLALQWERLQPVPGGPLDTAYLNRLKTSVAWAKASGDLVVPELHNFGRYSINVNGTLTPYIIDQLYGGAPRVTAAHLADVWVKLSNEFKDEPTVYAYDLMNEPHDMAGWKGISQTVLTAIRNNNDGKLVMIPGDSWSSGNRWVTTHGPTAWISDPLNNFMYEAHQYFDSDESGTYGRTYADELRTNPNLATIGARRISNFLDWCRNNGVRGYVGEYGVPDDPQWMAVLDGFMDTLDAAGVPASYWAAGEWWGNYALSVQPRASFTLDRPQMSVLLRHLEPGKFTSVSAASSSGSVFAPGTFMAGYGAGLTLDTKATTVEVTDSSGATTQSPLIFVSSGQINYRIPQSAAYGRAEIAVKAGDLVVSRGTYFLERTAPALFSATGAHNGPAAALIAREDSGGSIAYEYTTVFDPGQGAYIPNPIDPASSDSLTLVLFGTGFANPASPSAATLRIGSSDLPIRYVGPQGTIAGLDQINATLPRSLAGAGTVPVVFRIDGKTANEITLTFR